MFVIPAIAVFLTFVYLRPHEIFAAARPLTVNLVAGVVMLGFLLDLGTGKLRGRLTALHGAIVGLFGWYLLRRWPFAAALSGSRLRSRGACAATTDRSRAVALWTELWTCADSETPVFAGALVHTAGCDRRSGRVGSVSNW